MMKKHLLFILLVWLIPFSGIAQTYVEMLKSLNLPIYTFNQKPGSNEKITKSAFNADMSSADIFVANKIFNKATLYYDELNELDIVVYEVISQTIFKSNKNSLLRSIKKISGAEKNETDESGMYHVFISNGTEITLFEPNEKYRIIKPFLKITPVNNVKVSEKYNEANKTTTIYPINFNEWVNQDDLKYGITFIGYKESKKLSIKIISQSNNVKNFEKIEIKVDNGEVYATSLTTSLNTLDRGALGSITQEIGVAELPKEWVKKILNAKSTKISIQGKKTGIVTLTTDIMNALKAVSLKLYP